MYVAASVVMGSQPSSAPSGSRVFTSASMPISAKTPILSCAKMNMSGAEAGSLPTSLSESVRLVFFSNTTSTSGAASAR